MRNVLDADEYLTLRSPIIHPKNIEMQNQVKHPDPDDATYLSSSPWRNQAPADNVKGERGQLCQFSARISSEYPPNADWTPSDLVRRLPACNLSAAALAAIASIGSGCLMMCAAALYVTKPVSNLGPITHSIKPISHSNAELDDPAPSSPVTADAFTAE